MAEPAIRRLLSSDDTSQFHCGDQDYDLFLQRYAGQKNQDRLFVGTTYVACDGRLAACAFAVALQVRAAAGCVGVVVDVLPSRVNFYAELGFVELELKSGQSAIRPQPVAMFLPIAAVEAALDS